MSDDLVEDRHHPHPDGYFALTNENMIIKVRITSLHLLITD